MLSCSAKKHDTNQPLAASLTLKDWASNLGSDNFLGLPFDVWGSCRAEDAFVSLNNLTNYQPLPTTITEQFLHKKEVYWKTSGQWITFLIFKIKNSLTRHTQRDENVRIYRSTCNLSSKNWNSQSGSSVGAYLFIYFFLFVFVYL